MRIGIVAILTVILSFSPLTLCGQRPVHAGQDKARIAVFVCKNAGVSTSLEALRAELTRSLVNSAEGSYTVLDRTDDILALLKKTYKYQGSGFVRDDQLVDIGEQLGETLLYVVSVTYYREYGQYFFEGKFIDVKTTETTKSAIYPDQEKLQSPVSSLSPQDQIKAGRELAAGLELLSAEEIGVRQQLAKKREIAHKRREVVNQVKRISVFEDINFFGLIVGGGFSGVQNSIVLNIKYLHLGVGWSGKRGESFSLSNLDGFAGEKYPTKEIGLHFSTGVNFKYVGFAVCPEVFFLKDGRPVNQRQEEYDHVYKNISNPLVGLTPTLYLYAPVKTRYEVKGHPGLGIVGTVGYSFFPEIKDGGLQFAVGFGYYW